MNYIKYLIKEAQLSGFRCVAFNSRGVNMELSTPMPFNGNDLRDLNVALNKVK